jgi:hypothetical protein
VLHSVEVDESDDEVALLAREPGEDPAVQALARLEADLSAARTPARRRRIRMEIEAIRRNPWKAIGPLS